MLKGITTERGFKYIEMTAEEVAELEAQRLAEFEASWLHKARPIRVGMSDSDYISLLIDYPEFAMIRFNEQIPVEAQLEGNYLYLQYINDEDRQLFEYFGATIENYTAL